MNNVVLFLKVVAPAVTPTVVIAALAALIAYLQLRTNRLQAETNRLQAKTNQEKLRLDLYNRRFDIYRHCVDFARGLCHQNEPVRDSVAREESFRRSLGESRFLFPPSSGVYELLKEFDEHATYIVTTQRMGIPLTEAQLEKKDQAFSRVDPFIAALGEKMVPLLKFHDL
jgi:hypothetical protein